MKVGRFGYKKQDITALLVALIVTCILFYIDEGYYSMGSFKKPGNYIPFLLYAAGTWFGQFAVARLFYRNQSGFDKIMFNTFVGVPVGVALTVLFFIGLRTLTGG